MSVRHVRDDQGAVATVVALLLAGGVLLGLMALVVDVGQIYAEREQLQSGADAAALGVARACATNAGECQLAFLEDVAQHYADSNAADGVAFKATVCGRLTGGILTDTLPDCPAPPANLTACLGSPPDTAPYVEVRLSTVLPSDRFVLPPSVGSGMAGNAGTSVAACARATWRNPGEVTILGLTIPTCQAGQPPFVAEDDVSAGIEDVIDLATISSCPAPAPWNPPTAGAVLDTDATDCTLTMPGDGVMTGFYVDHRPLVPAACAARLQAALDTGRALYAPVHDGVRPVGGNVMFHGVYLAKLVVTGFSVRTDDPAATGPVGSLSPAAAARCMDPHACISAVYVGRLELADLVGDSTVNLIG